MAWCCEVYHQRCVAVEPQTQDSSLAHAVSAALDIAHHCTQVPWPKVEMALKTLRQTLGKFDERVKGVQQR